MVSEAMSRLLEIMKQNFSLFATTAIVLVALALYVRCGGSLSGPNAIAAFFHNGTAMLKNGTEVSLTLI